MSSKRSGRRSAAPSRGRHPEELGDLRATSMRARWDGEIELQVQATAARRWLQERLLEIAGENPRYGYRRAWALLRRAGHKTNHKRVFRVWQELGLSLPRRRKRRRYVSTNSVPQAAERPNHVWTCDFFFDSCVDGRQLKILAVLDEYTRKCLALEVGTSIRSRDVIAVLERLFEERGAPEFIRSDNGPEFVSKALEAWLDRQEAESIFIKPGSPWQNGYVESFGDKLRDECLNAELFINTIDAEFTVGMWKTHYNRERSHSALGYLTPCEYECCVAEAAAPGGTPRGGRLTLSGPMTGSGGLGPSKNGGD